MTNYIKGKDGKFAGSIGAGKTAVPTPAPTPHLPGLPTANLDAPAPVTSPRSHDLHHFVEAHARAWSWYADNGTHPSAVHPSDFTGTHPLIDAHPHLAPYLAQIRTPDEVGTLTENLTDQPAQVDLLTDLCAYGEELEQLAGLVRGYCYECESLEGQGYCAAHAEVGNMEVEDYLSETLPHIHQAVMDDFLPVSGNDPESAAVAATLLPNPFHPGTRP